MHKKLSQAAPVMSNREQQEDNHHGSEFLTLTKEAIVLLCDSTGRSEILNYTRCSNDGEIALFCDSCNLIAVVATIREIYPKFLSFPCYQIHLYNSRCVTQFMSLLR